MQTSFLKRIAIGLTSIAFVIGATYPTLAAVGDQDSQFLEISEDTETVIFDLATVRVIIPGRFTIVQTYIDHPDTMKFKLTVLDTLRNYCSLHDGRYQAPESLFTLGRPDMPIERIEVSSSSALRGITNCPFKSASWSYPYDRLAMHFKDHSLAGKGFLNCQQWCKSGDELYLSERAVILNGLRTSELYDCKRGLTGTFISDVDNDPAKVTVLTVRPGTFAFAHYTKICERVVHEMPFIPSAP
jgi:hypothetical protein